MINQSKLKEVLILRSHRLEGLDITPGIKNALDNVNISENINFTYIDNNLERNINQQLLNK